MAAALVAPMTAMFLDDKLSEKRRAAQATGWVPWTRRAAKSASRGGLLERKVFFFFGAEVGADQVELLRGDVRKS